MMPGPAMQPSQHNTSRSCAAKSPSANSRTASMHLAASLGDDDFAGHEVFLQTGRLKHASRDRKQTAHAAVRRIEIGSMGSVGKNAVFFAHAPQLGECQNCVDFARHLGFLRFDLLGDARADEDDFQVVAMEASHHAGHGHHRRNDRARAIRSNRDNNARRNRRWPDRWSRYSDGRYCLREALYILARPGRPRRKPRRPDEIPARGSCRRAGYRGVRRIQRENWAPSRLRCVRPSGAWFALRRSCCARAWHVASKCARNCRKRYNARR